MSSLFFHYRRDGPLVEWLSRPFYFAESLHSITLIKIYNDNIPYEKQSIELHECAWPTLAYCVLNGPVH